jgi:predicted unusual protein kinase regulating ubiquinone biosynthesis (AarF/ABC1/UbiB family)
VFDKVWGLNMTELANLPFEEMSGIAKEFSDLLLSMPFQMPQDFIYLSRAVGILSGMCTGLDPEFDPWREMQPFTQKLLENSSEQTQTILGSQISNARSTVEVTSKLVLDFVTKLYKLPTLADNVLMRANRGELEVKMSPDDTLKKQISRIEQSTNQLVVGMIFATLAVVSTLLYINNEHSLGIAGYLASAFTLLVMFIRSR